MGRPGTETDETEPTSASWKKRALGLLKADDGPLTRELLREPSRFGLGQVPERTSPDAVTTLVCGYCSTGCGLVAHLKGGVATSLSPASDHPVNLGMACPKGWEALRVLDAPDRATIPLLRNEAGELEPVAWGTALDVFVERFQRIQQEHGGDACAFLGTGQLPSEELAFLGALGRFGLGFAHGDGNTRQCMATAMTAYKESFGFDAPPYSYDDFEASDVIVLLGSNLCIAHPIMWERICRNPNDPKIVVIDPRRTETAMAATHHYPVAPKADLALLQAVAHELIRNEWIDREFIDAHTEGFDEFAAQVAGASPEAVAAEVGLSPDAVRELARLVYEGKRVSFWWTMGVNQSHQAVRVAEAIIALALMTGNIGRPGTGANSITGQCNAMGSRMFSATSSLFCGRDFESATHRAEVASILDVPVERIPSEVGLAYDEVIEGIHAGRIKGLWVVATNGAHSWIHQHGFRRAMEKLDFLVVQDMYASTETAELADLVLPAAGWGEKEGTFINSERRIGLLKKVRRAPGQALADFQVFRLVAEAWGCGPLFDRWKSPEDAFGLMRALSRGRPNDIGGIESYEMIDRAGGIQWPLAAGDAPPSTGRRLFEDGRFHHANGRARFITEAPVPPAEPTCADYPLVLLTGRGGSSQWHTQTRTSKSPVLRKLHPVDPYVEISPDDAARLGIDDDARVRIRSRRGEMEARARVRPTVRPGQVFIPMHHVGTNRLTHPTVDPHSRQPSYKHCAVHIERAE